MGSRAVPPSLNVVACVRRLPCKGLQCSDTTDAFSGSVSNAKIPVRSGGLAKHCAGNRLSVGLVLRLDRARRRESRPRKLRKPLRGLFGEIDLNSSYEPRSRGTNSHRRVVWAVRSHSVHTGVLFERLSACESQELVRDLRSI